MLKLSNAIKEFLQFTNIDTYKDDFFKDIPWGSIAAKVGTRDARQCYSKWEFEGMNLLIDGKREFEIDDYTQLLKM